MIGIMRTSKVLRWSSTFQASLALGIDVATVLSVVLRTGLTGILTGVMLAVARAFGETAPLLFTALGSRLVNVGNFSKPMDSLPVFVYTNARAPITALNQQAWGAALLLLLIVLTINIAVRARRSAERFRVTAVTTMTESPATPAEPPQPPPATASRCPTAPRPPGIQGQGRRLDRGRGPERLRRLGDQISLRSGRRSHRVIGPSGRGKSCPGLNGTS